MTERHVIVIDDHPGFSQLYSDALSALLEPRGCTVLRPVDRVEAVPSAPGARSVAMCDIHLGHGRLFGSRAVAHLKSKGWNVLLFSHAAPRLQMLECVVAGANGFIPSSRPDKLVEWAVVRVADGLLHMSAELAEAILQEFRRENVLNPWERKTLRRYECRFYGGPTASEADQRELQRLFRTLAVGLRGRKLTLQQRRVAWAVACGGVSSIPDMAKLIDKTESNFSRELSLLLASFKAAFERDYTVVEWLHRETGRPLFADEAARYDPAELRKVSQLRLTLPGEPEDRAELKAQTAARLWARRLGLCAGDCPEK
ncbi:response regulator transcription factor [Actinomadura decatromicini]|uniref:Response regulator transcription factor n=1 Tax=Actinomadura decatromicini TaxID=2604572 RepID=A0A5D3FUD1_9ACTN|nr:response regulator transcription factor [Actinomadura decatromicini]TYK52457.1 response regulator transcription factor [Actinomadura decatromicini]